MAWVFWVVPRLPQVQIADDGGGPQVKDLLHRGLQLAVGHHAGAERLHQHADGTRHACLLYTSRCV